MTIRPHLLIFALALAAFVLAVFSSSATHVIHLHDTYLVIAAWHVRVGIGVLATLFAGTYWLLQRAGRPLPRHLGHMHFAMTALGVVLPALGLAWADTLDTLVPAALVLFGMVLFVAGTLLMIVGSMYFGLRYRKRPRQPGGNQDDQ